MSTEKKKSIVVGVIVMVHVFAAGALFLMPGCGTTSPAVVKPVDPVMPPRPVEVREPAPPATRPVAKQQQLDLPAATTEYIVRKGDTLSGIASRYGLAVAELMAVNAITDPDKIQVGQTLRLPGKVDLEQVQVQPARAKQPVATDGAEYVVQAGDSLSVIAARYSGVSVQDLKEANGLTGELIKVGQKLVIPGVKDVVPPRVSAPPAPSPSAAPAGREVPQPRAQPAAAVTTPPTPPAPAADTRIHVVAPSEDLYTVAMMYDVGVQELKELNGLRDASLRPGQRLMIPLPAME